MHDDHQEHTDPLTQLNQLDDALDAIDGHLRTADATVKRATRYRLSLLHAHAGFAMVIAGFFAALGRDGMRGPSFAILKLIPGAPHTLAALLFAGGLTLGVGTWRRHLHTEITGLWLLMCWYATIAAGFSGAILTWWVGGAPPGPAKPSLYPAWVYAHVLVVLAVHHSALQRIRRARKRDRR